MQAYEHAGQAGFKLEWREQGGNWAIFGASDSPRISAAICGPEGSGVGGVDNDIDCPTDFSLVPVQGFTPESSVGTSGYRGQYIKIESVPEFNETLQMTATAFERIDGIINMDFGNGGPEQDGFQIVGTNDFGIKWTGYFYVPQNGFYGFKAGSDDGLLLWIDPESDDPDTDEAFINLWSTHGYQTQTNVLYLTAGAMHLMVVQGYERNGQAKFTVEWMKPGEDEWSFFGATESSSPDPFIVAPTCVPPDPFETTTACVEPGWDVELIKITSSPPTDLNDVRFTAVVQAIDINFGGGAPYEYLGLNEIQFPDVNRFALRWTGHIVAHYDGQYWFEMGSDDGCRVYIGDMNTPKFQFWQDRGFTSSSTSGFVELSRGVHRIVVEGYENGGGARFELYWRPPWSPTPYLLSGDDLHPYGGASVYTSCCEVQNFPANTELDTDAQPQWVCPLQCVAGYTATTNTAADPNVDPACAECAVGKYKTQGGNGDCADCQQLDAGETWDNSGTGLTSAGDCMPTCLPGYAMNNGGKCTACPSSAYKTGNNDGPCETCTELGTGETYETTATGKTSSAACVPTCSAGYEQLSGSSACVPCEEGYYKSAPGTGPCTACVFDETSETFDGTSDGLTASTQCDPVCEAGWFESTKDVCTQCVADTYKDDSGDHNCTLCPPPATGETYESTGEGKAAVGACVSVCEAGYERVGGTCQLCQPGKYKSSVGDYACSECQTNRNQGKSTQGSLNKLDNSHFTHDTTSPVTDSKACTYTCNAGYGGAYCEACGAGNWQKGNKKKWQPCKNCINKGWPKPPNSQWKWDGSDPSKQKKKDTACDYVCNGEYEEAQPASGGGYDSKYACGKHPLCGEMQFYNDQQHLGPMMANGSCWQYMPKEETFDDARRKCRDLGGQLAMIEYDEQQAMFAYARDTWVWKYEAEQGVDYDVGQTWLSFTDRVAEDVWTGMSGENFPLPGGKAGFRNWKADKVYENEDERDCAVVGSGNRWKRAECDRRRPFVCAFPRAPYFYQSCSEAQIEASNCHKDANCIVAATTDGAWAPVCTCPEGYVGTGNGDNGCSPNGYTVRFSLYLDSDAVAVLDRDSNNVLVTGKGKLFFWDVYRDAFAALLSSSGGDTETARRSLPPNFLFSMEHSVTLIESLSGGKSALNASNSEGFVLLGVPAGAEYMLTINAVFASRADADTALDTLLINLNETGTQEDFPEAFGTTLAPGSYPVLPRVYRWSASEMHRVEPTGMEVQSVEFDPTCANSGCWVVNVLYTTGFDNFNTFFLPEAVGNDALAYDFDYTVDDATWGISPEDTFLPNNHPCNTFNYDPNAAADPSQNEFYPINAPEAVTSCCMPEFVDMYRPIQSFVDDVVTANAISDANCKLGIVKTFARPNWNPPPPPGPTPYDATAPVNCSTTFGADIFIAGGLLDEDAFTCYAPGGTGGSITHAYSAGDKIAWLLVPPPFSAIELEFDFFETRPELDSVQLFECTAADCNSWNDVLASGSGAYDRFAVTSCESALLVVLDASAAASPAPAPGFAARYRSLDSCPYSGSTRKSLRAPGGAGESVFLNRVTPAPPNTLPTPSNHLFGYFRDLDYSWAEFESVVDPFIGQYTANIYLDEVELRRNAGMLRGTVGVEHTVDTFIGLANFKPTGLDFIDPFATQVNLHLEKTNFFSVSTHGVNEYTFLEYVNLRLISVLTEDADFSGVDESLNRTVRTDDAAAAHYVQVTFTLGSQYVVDPDSDMVPMDSVRAGDGVFISDAATVMEHKCLEYKGLDGYSFADKTEFDEALGQTCAPGASMCVSPAAVPDHFVSFNIPLGIDYLGAPTEDLSYNVFVSFVVFALDQVAKGNNPTPTDPGAGEAPWQMKTTLTASIPVVAGGLNIFCDGVTAKTDLRDVADADIVVGSAFNATELSRLRIVSNVASTQLDPQESLVSVDSASIQAGLMTLVLKGNSSYFGPGNSGLAGVSLELEDVITIHIMQGDDGRGENADVAGDVEALITDEDPADNSDTNGLITDGYTLNGAFELRMDREAHRAHLEPRQALLAICPFTPTRFTGTDAELETCITRRDVRYRNYPARLGSVSTAMEICANLGGPGFNQGVNAGNCEGAACCGAMIDEKAFMATIFSDNDFSDRLAVSFAETIADTYKLNQRFRRAFWINPAYEWTPTQTGGKPIFSVSQKCYMFALIIVDEGITDEGGEALTPAGPTFSRRRMLLQAAESLQDAQAGVGGASVEFETSPRGMMASVYGVPEDRVATFDASFALTDAEACMDPRALQAALRTEVDSFAKKENVVSDFHTIQFLSLSIDRGGVTCERRSRLLKAAGATADTTMMVVFKPGSPAQIDVAKFAQMGGGRITSFEPINLSPKVDPNPIEITKPPEDESGSDNTAVIAGVAGGVGGGLLLAGAGMLYMRKRDSASNNVEVPVAQSVDINSLKAQLTQDL